MPSATAIRASFHSGNHRQTLTFDRPFRIGRVKECEVRIVREFVSRTHAEVVFEQQRWWIRDLQSSNGIFINDQKVKMAPLEGAVTVRLGASGPSVLLEVER